MTIRSEVLASAQWIAENSKAVRIDKDQLRQFADTLKNMKPSYDSESDRRYYLEARPCEAALYHLLCAGINFCFWEEKGEKKWMYSDEQTGQKIGGARGMYLAVRRAVEKDKKFLDADYLATIPFEHFARIFSPPGTQGQIPMLEERHEITQENFFLLAKKARGQLINIVKAAGGDVDKFVSSILSHFPSFRDQSVYKGRNVGFYKRAQLLAGDLQNRIFKGGLMAFRNMEALTAMADYRLPQLFEHFWVLRYSPELIHAIDNWDLIPPGSDYENEIRGCMLWAFELIRQEIERLTGRKVLSADLDDICWNMAQNKAMFQRTHHRTPTAAY